MKKLNDEQIQTLEDGIHELRGLGNELENAMYEYNETVREAHEKLTQYIDEYNTKVCEMREFRDEIVDQITEYIGEHSDKWRDGEVGQKVQEWLGEWEGVDMYDFDTPEEPTELGGECDINHADALEAISHAIQKD